MTAASFKAGGTRPVHREELMTAVIRGMSWGRHDLTRVEGMGSRMEVEVFMPMTREARSAVVI